VRSKFDHCVYYKAKSDQVLVITFYVVDMLFIGNRKLMIFYLKSQLSAKFEMKDLGAARYILGIEITRDRKNRNLWLRQSKYVNTILEIFCMNDCK
jgi:hypothetical protein